MAGATLSGAQQFSVNPAEEYISTSPALIGDTGTKLEITTPASYLEIRNRLIGMAKEAGVGGESVIVDVGPFVDGVALEVGKVYYIDRNTGFNTVSGTEIGVAVSATKLKLKTFI